MRYRVARPFKNPKSSFHWFRLSVPKDLRERVGRTEIRQSLGTRDAAEAAVLEAQLTAKWKTEFRRLRDSIAAEGLAEAPAVVDRFLQRLADGAHGDLDGVVYGIQKLITTNLLTAWGPDEFRARHADLALGFMPDDESWDGWQEDPLSNVIPEDRRDALVARIRLLHRSPQALGAGFRSAIRHIQEGRRWDAVRFHVMMISEVTGTDIPFPSEFHDAVAEAFVSRLLNYRSYRWDMELLESVSADLDRSTGPTLPSAADLYPVPAPTAPPPSAAAWNNAGARYQPGQTLSVGLTTWIAQKAPGASAIAEASRAVERFVDLFGDKEVAAITSNEMFDYRDFLTDMPAGLQLPLLKASGKTLRGAVEEAKAREAGAAAQARASGEQPRAPRRLSPTSIKKDIGALSAIFTALTGERWILANPAEKIPITGYTKGKKVLPLRPDMMAKLFASPLFTGCKGKRDADRTKPGPHIYQDELYWSFLFGATSGHRLEELGQVLVDDVVEVEGPDGSRIAGIFVTGTGVDQSVKNNASMRVIVVHPRLIELGFLDYVNGRKAQGATRLFDLKKSKRGTWTQKLSQRVNRYIDRVIVDDRRYVFHSLRHEFADRSEITVSTEVSKKIMGHARGRLYGLGAPLHHAAAELQKVDLSFIDWDRLSAAARR